jgi:cysteine synthase A
VEPSFIGSIVDRMHRVPDAASVATMRELETILGRRVGPSTGTSVWACLELINGLRDDGLDGSIVTLLCDSGDRYAGTYFDDDWVAARGWDLAPYRVAVRDFLADGRWTRS